MNISVTEKVLFSGRALAHNVCDEKKRRIVLLILLWMHKNTRTVVLKRTGNYAIWPRAPDIGRKSRHSIHQNQTNQIKLSTKWLRGNNVGLHQELIFFFLHQKIIGKIFVLSQSYTFWIVKWICVSTVINIVYWIFVSLGQTMYTIKTSAQITSVNMRMRRPLFYLWENVFAIYIKDQRCFGAFGPLSGTFLKILGDYYVFLVFGS